SDELRQAAPGRALQARAQRPESRDPVDVDRLGDAFNARGAARLEREVSFDQPTRVFSDRNRAGRRDGLHPRGEIGRVPDWSVLDIAGAGCYRAHDDFAGVDADPNLERRTSVGEQTIAVAT